MYIWRYFMAHCHCQIKFNLILDTGDNFTYNNDDNAHRNLVVKENNLDDKLNYCYLCQVSMYYVYKKGLCIVHKHRIICIWLQLCHLLGWDVINGCNGSQGIIKLSNSNWQFTVVTCNVRQWIKGSFCFKMYCMYECCLQEIQDLLFKLNKWKQTIYDQ